MEVLFDLQLSNGEALNGISFIEYHRPIKGGKHSNILAWAASHMNCYDANDIKIASKNFDQAILLRAYDKESGEDVTDFYKMFINHKMSMGLRMGDRHPFARDVVRLEE